MSGTDMVQGGAFTAAKYDPANVGLSDLANIARVLSASGYFNDSREASQAFAKILAGQELGIGPFRALKEVQIISGSPTLSAGATAALIKASKKYDYREVERTDERCVLDFYEKGEKVGQVTWTMSDAKRARLVKPNGGWEKFPRRMLFARAITEGATTYCPDVFGGPIYTPEELGAIESAIEDRHEDVGRLEPPQRPEEPVSEATGSEPRGEPAPQTVPTPLGPPGEAGDLTSRVTAQLALASPALKERLRAVCDHYGCEKTPAALVARWGSAATKPSELVEELEALMAEQIPTLEGSVEND